jgi:hypothetical protein
MNFAPPLRPYQLCFPFLEERGPEAVTPWERARMGRSAWFNRRRMQRAVSLAIELERRRRRKRVAVRRGNDPRPFFPSRLEANELELLARRVARLCPSHRRPEYFFEEKDEIAFALRAIAARGRASNAR